MGRVARLEVINYLFFFSSPPPLREKTMGWEQVG
jgi:hypothetical protein